MKTRRIIVRILALAVVIGIAICMAVIGRGHTVYFDNKEKEFDGTTYSAFYKVEVFVDGEKVASVDQGDRGMVKIMGQKFSMELHITPKKGGKKVGSSVSLPIPYNMDGLVLNIPAMLQGAPEEAYMEEFVPTPVVEDDTEVVVGGDEFEMPVEG